MTRKRYYILFYYIPYRDYIEEINIVWFVFMLLFAQKCQIQG